MLAALRLIRNAIAIAALVALTCPASAQFAESSPSMAAVGVNAPGAAAAPAAAAATQNTVTTTGPVTSETTITVGTLAAQVLDWVVITFGTVVGTAVTTLIVRWFKLLGIQVTDAARARLGQLVLNGMHAGAAAAEAELKGKGQIEIKDATVAKTIAYVQAHGADTIKQLGLEPTEQKAVEAIKARIAVAVADPDVPTPAVMDAPEAPKDSQTVAPKPQ